MSSFTAPADLRIVSATHMIKGKMIISVNDIPEMRPRQVNRKPRAGDYKL